YMEFFWAEDVLRHSTASSPDDPVTVNLDDSIQEALQLMLKNDFDQLPVVSEYGVEGTVTYKSVTKYVKSIDVPRVNETSVKIALNTSPTFVDREQDLFDLFDTLAEDDYVLIGNQDELEGILTRYDVFYFLEYQVEPLLKIGDIEESLRHLFRKSFSNLDQRIEETFAERSEYDSSYDPPEGLEKFSFDEYRMFMMRNLDQLPPRLSQEQDMVESLLEDIRETRNALFHFRAKAEDVDRDQLDLAHGYFTGIAKSI
ncbi:MAG: CBS domain-containing protein, partial [Halobacteriaceae archaeon]